jgi:hypothetical protein
MITNLRRHTSPVGQGWFKVLVIMRWRRSSESDQLEWVGEGCVGDLSQSGGDAVVAGVAECVEREVPQCGHVRWAVPGADLGGVLAWLHGPRRLRTRWEMREDIHYGFLQLAHCMILARTLPAF